MHEWRWPRVLAHRCGGRLAPENSLAGLRQAAAHAITGVEFDAMLAADGAVVVIHDDTLDRTTDACGPVAGLPGSALRALRLRDADGRLTDERLPDLGGVLATCAALKLAANVEIKPGAGREAETGARVAAQVAEFIAATPMAVLLSSFSPDALAQAQRVAPELPRGLLLERPPRDAAAQARALACEAVIVNAAHLSADFVRRMTNARLAVACYTVDDAARASELLDWGVAGVISDEPHRLRAASGS